MSDDIERCRQAEKRFWFHSTQARLLLKFRKFRQNNLCFVNYVLMNGIYQNFGSQISFSTSVLLHSSRLAESWLTLSLSRGSRKDFTKPKENLESEEFQLRSIESWTEVRDEWLIQTHLRVARLWSMRLNVSALKTLSLLNSTRISHHVLAMKLPLNSLNKQTQV